MMLSDVCLCVCLSVAYIGPKSRTERPRKTKIGTEVVHVTRDSNTTFQVKRSRSPGRCTHRGVYTSGSCSGERGKVFTVWTYTATLPSAGAAVGSAARGASAPHKGRRGAGAYRGGHLPTACFTAQMLLKSVKFLCQFWHFVCHTGIAWLASKNQIKFI